MTAARLRVALIGFSHEANSFAPVRVDADYVRAAGMFRGDAVVEEYRGGDSTTGGFIAAAENDGGVELVPLCMATPTPAGVITADVMDDLCREFDDLLRGNGPFDAVLVTLHGAAVSERVLDVDGCLLGIIRAAVGPGTVVGTSLDLHANISAEMCEHVDVLNVYQTNPHVDAAVVAEELAHLVFAAARREVAPVIAHVPVPAFINILQQNTSEEPMRGILAAARAAVVQEGLLSLSVVEGYPYADVPEMGMSVVAVADGDADRARAAASRIADLVWRSRQSFEVTAPGVDEALALVSGLPQPVLLLDVGDNIGAGSPGDSVELLHAAVAAGCGDVLTIVVDPVAVRRSREAGTGAVLPLDLGAAVHRYPRGPLRCEATVLALGDGTFESDEMLHAGFRHFDAGPSAVLRLATGQTVLVVSSAVMPLTVAQFQPFGIDVREFSAIIAKGVHSPLAGYGPYVRSILRVDSAGVTSAGCLDLPYRNRRRPMHPFEPDAAFAG